MKVSLLICCYNEEKVIANCIVSCLNQTRPADEIIVVDDASTDLTYKILKKYQKKIKLLRLFKNGGNKSYAQQYGLQFISGDIFITIDADSMLDQHFIERIVDDFVDEKVVAVGGYIKSSRYNWLTACRALDYTIGQNIHKLAQSYLNFLFVIPGTAGAFKTEIFKKYINFEHDTVAEDLDFTYKLHKKGLKIKYDRQAIVYTQDPTDLKSYINQMRRWYGGGWQNLLKHLSIIQRPAQALQLSLIYVEGLIFSLVLYLLPIINLKIAVYLLLFYLATIIIFTLYALIKERRLDLIFIPPLYLFIMYINAAVFLEQFFQTVILRSNKLTWYQPKRIKI